MEKESISHSRIERSTTDNFSIANTTGHGTKCKPWRVFQVVKSSALGLGAAQGIYFQVVVVDSDDGIEVERVKEETAYHTSRLMWYKQRVHLPPNFKVYSGPQVSRKSNFGSKPEHEVAVVKYKGWEGMFGMSCEVEIPNEGTGISFQNRLPQEIKTEQVMVGRSGMGRTYDVSIGPAGQQLIWKGSKKIVDGVDDDAPRCNGNLKLFRPEQPERTLAVWKNRTDPTILGAVLVLEDFGNEGFFLEMVLWTCLSVVLAERMSARGWLGGLGH